MQTISRKRKVSQSLVSGRSNVLEDSPSEGPRILNQSGVRVTYKKGLKRITLERYLISLLVYSPDKVTFEQILVIYDNLIWLLEKALKDPDFKRVFGMNLELISSILKEKRITSENLNNKLLELSKELKEQCSGFLYPRRNIGGVSKYVLGHFHVLPTRSQGIPTKELKPKPYIGVGYKDKGTYRDVAWDGSPSWQEVAMSHPGEI